MNQFPIPKELNKLVTDGFWPKDMESANRQNLCSLVPEPVIRKFAPEESKLYLLPPPFSTVRSLMRKGEHDFWLKFGTIAEIDPDHTVVIGDFGLGSDAPIALDYRKDINNPTVIRLNWTKDGNHWIQIAPTFEGFVACLKIGAITPPSGG